MKKDVNKYYEYGQDNAMLGRQQAQDGAGSSGGLGDYESSVALLLFTSYTNFFCHLGFMTVKCVSLV